MIERLPFRPSFVNVVELLCNRCNALLEQMLVGMACAHGLLDERALWDLA